MRLTLLVFQRLQPIHAAKPRFAYRGYFHLNQPKNAQGRFQKIQPPKELSPEALPAKEADFILFGYDVGPLCIECKNYREWLYPHEPYIANLIIKAINCGAMPVSAAPSDTLYEVLGRCLAPAGIVAHESYFGIYASDKATLAEQVKNKRLLGFTDVLASE